MSKYYCKHCGRTVMRESKQAWINSFCTKVGKVTMLVRK